MKQIRFIENPRADDIGDSPEEFLDWLGQAACLFLPGENPGITRAFVSLLHGNEPSGASALFRWLKSGRKPVVNMLCLLPSVQAALQAPVYTNRMLTGYRDLNRCFRAPFSDQQGELAEEILELLKRYQPECVVDMHNTSGSGPGFGVAVSTDAQHRALVSQFTSTLVTNDLRLGALMEISEHLFPTVTIECGGRLDEEAHRLAWQGLQRYMTTEDVFSEEFLGRELNVYRNPVRLELLPDCKIAYADSAQKGFDLTLKNDIEKYNFEFVSRGTSIGWVDSQDLSVFSAHNLQQQDVVERLLLIEQGEVRVAQDLKLFMVTSNADIARLDCLFYAASLNGDSVLAA